MPVERPLAAVVSFRLGGADGVSVEASHWISALRRLGFDVRTVAGSGIADLLLPGLGLDTAQPLLFGELDRALADADLVIVENVCSLPLNPQAATTLQEYLAGRPTILHHHDLPWERERFAHVQGWPPQDPAWIHVSISEQSREQLAARGIPAVTVYNGFATGGAKGRRLLTRKLLDLSEQELLLLQPTRAIVRKNVAGGIALAEELEATYWLTGPEEEGYGATLLRILSQARCSIRRHLPPGTTMADAYAAADGVVLPSTWEGFGAPLIESALQRRPLAVSNYPVAAEIARFGFRWFAMDEVNRLRAWFERPDYELIEHNYEIAERHFSLEALTGRIARVLRSSGWKLDFHTA